MPESPISQSAAQRAIVGRRRSWHPGLLVVLVAAATLTHSDEGRAAIVYHGVSSRAVTGPGITVNKPVPLSSGDVMIASVVIAYHGPVVTPATPAGWNVIRTTTQGVTLKQITYYKVATGAEAASYSFSSGSGADDYVAGITAYSGVDNTSPIDASLDNKGTTGKIVSPSVTDAASNDYVIAAFGLNNLQTVTPDATTTLRWRTGIGSLEGGAADFAQAAAGATAAKTSTPSSALYPWTAQTISLHVPSSLTATTAATPTFSQALDGSDHTQSYTVPITLTVAGTTGGWNLAITSTQFTTGTRTLSTSASTVNSVATTCVTTCVTPTDGISRPVAVPAAPTPPAAAKFTNAAAGTGDGQFTVTPTIGVAIPATSYAGSYSSTLTLSSVAGP